MRYLKQQDPVIAAFVEKEAVRQAIRREYATGQPPLLL